MSDVCTECGALLRPVEGDELARMNRNLLSRIRELETERVGGVVLTREEAVLAAEELRDAAAGWTASDEHDRAGACDALAARLEAAS